LHETESKDGASQDFFVFDSDQLIKLTSNAARRPAVEEAAFILTEWERLRKLRAGEGRVWSRRRWHVRNKKETRLRDEKPAPRATNARRSRDANNS